METLEAERKDVARRLTKINTRARLLAFFFLVPVPLALMGMLDVAGWSCLGAVLFVALFPGHATPTRDEVDELIKDEPPGPRTIRTVYVNGSCDGEFINTDALGQTAQEGLYADIVHGHDGGSNVLSPDAQLYGLAEWQQHR